MRYEQIIIELQKQIDENKRKIVENTKNKDALISCQSGINNTLSLFFSLIPYFTLFGTMSFLYGNGNISIPTELSAGIIAGGSLAATAVSKKILTKKSRKKLQREYGKYSGYTESKNLEETIGLVIEIEKLKNKNKVLKTTIDKLKEQKKQEEGTAKRAEQLQAKIKETVSEDSEKYRKEIQRLKEELDKKY